MKRKWFIGIDISKKTLDIVIYEPGALKQTRHFRVSNDSKGFKSFMKRLTLEKVRRAETFVCLEFCGVYGLDIGCFLEGKMEFCFCAPLSIKRSLGLTRGKNDKLDAQKIARYCYLFRDELSPSKMPSQTMIRLKNLMTERTRITKVAASEKTVLKEFSSRLDTDAVNRIKRRIKLLSDDIATIESEAVRLITQDEQLYKNYDLLLSITGIGFVNAVMFILSTNNFKGITDARSFACYCGVAPFEHSSGSSIRGKTRVSKLANKKIKADLTNAARSAVVNDPELHIYYKRKLDEGKAHGTVLNAVKFKLITRVFAVINRQTPFVKLRQAG